MVEMLRRELKLKVTADLAKDGKIHFLGREILRSEPGGDLKFGMDPGYMQDVLEEYKLENAKGLPTPPCLRDLLDKSLDEASLRVPLTPEAAARYRRALGKLSWLSATRGDLVYYISVLARGQSSPLEVHERAMRAVLRYLKTVVTVVHYFQVFPRQRQSHMILRAYVDASWGSERSGERPLYLGRMFDVGESVHQDVGAPPAIRCFIFCRERAVCTRQGFQGSLGGSLCCRAHSWGMRGRSFRSSAHLL